ncbi:hypothetical protein ACFQZJ_10235 [Maribacter chungangensis]|uniref:Uncharacterized protein n=1 Tax=Maribacter chungangensis TaxID=1069117 RepID=A0ABW3B3Y5_9FLAO
MNAKSYSTATTIGPWAEYEKGRKRPLGVVRKDGCGPNIPLAPLSKASGGV